MPRSLSKSQIDKPGERLAAPVAAEVDLDSLEALRGHDYANALDDVVAILRDLGVVPGDELTARLKTNATIIDKLRRGTKLSSMQDLAGVRVVRRMSLTQQDEFVANLGGHFVGPGGEPQFKVTDRRAAPSSGYRAVHVVVRSEGCPVEGQVRTFLQHLWANTFEFLADKAAFGRGIRYGGQSALERTSEGHSTGQILSYMMSLSGEFAALERFADSAPGAQFYIEESGGEALATLLEMIGENP